MAAITVEILKAGGEEDWDGYVHSHSLGTLYHLSGWKGVIEKTYGHKTYYLMATKEKLGSWEAERLGRKNQLKAEGQTKIQPTTSTPLNSLEKTSEADLTGAQNQSNSKNKITPAKLIGILPLVYIKHFLFGNSLISVPFLDYGGVLADDEETEIALLNEAVKLAQKLSAKNIELRNIYPNTWLNISSKLKAQSHRSAVSLEDSKVKTKNSKENISSNSINPINSTNLINCTTKSSKVRMLLKLPESSEELMQSFKSKLRSQIKKPIKEGLKPKVGGRELLDDFYQVFSINMRDLGSPVHSMKMMVNVLNEFTGSSNIVIIYKNHIPMACSLVAGHQDTLENPWASSLKEYSKLAPNMLLYWTMLKYACDNGFKFFDFGRCTPGSGSYKFKNQWGAKPEPLHWINISLKGDKANNSVSEDSKFQLASEVWKKLPVPVTRVIGPMIRKYIGL